MATILSATDLAAELGTDARTARKFLRSITPKENQPGKGSRWGIEKAKVRSMRPKFAAYQKAQEEAAKARAEKADEAPEVEAEAPVEGPTDAELEAIENEG